MYNEKEQVVISSLLHDVGKLYGRAMGSRKKHSEDGADYIRGKAEKTKEWENIIDGIRFHHEEALRSANLSDEHIAYIICEADNISAGLDRRVIEQDGKMMWDKKSSLKSVFNIIDGNKKEEEFSYDLKALKKDDPVNYPKKEMEINISQQRYEYVLNDFEKGINQFIQEKMSVNSLLRLIELAFFSIPSSTDASQQTDVSLYHHSKTTAMLSSAMYQYFSENSLMNFKKNCLLEKEKLRNENMFLMVSGDISGIQKFIYSISSKGALKSLRGRSFYLEILTEHIIDEILEELELSRANLIYSGGGHFYLLLPNTEKTKKSLDVAGKKINSWLLDKYKTDLYIQISYTEATANNLANNLSEKVKKSNELGEIYKNVGSKVSEGKLKRYGVDVLKEIMIENLEKDSLSGGRECSVCGRESDLIMEDEVDVCVNCKDLFLLGDFIPRMHHAEEPYFISITSNEGKFDSDVSSSVELPSIIGDRKYLSVLKLPDAEKILKEDPDCRFYSINNDSFGYNFANNIWVATYNAENNDKSRTLIDLELLAERSTGIKRIAMLKADVDNLGSIFKSAFINKNGQSPFQFVSISRNTTLSYFLSMFFKYEINKISEGSDKEFYILKDIEKNKPYNLVIIYSGGDDVLVVGSWDEVLEFAVNLRKAFQKYTMNSMTISAGIGLFSHGYPINQMAKITDALEGKAKDNGKDSISLFDESENHTYKWDEFEQDVMGDKFAKLYKWFDIGEESENRSKIPFSPTGFYRLMLYVSELVNGNSKKINIAKVAYTIARMEPDKNRMATCKENYEEFKNIFYSWIINKEDLRKLLTAMTLIIYLNRKE